MASKSSGKRKAAPVVGQRSISAFFKPSTGPLQVIDNVKVEHSAKKQKSAQKQQPTHKASTPVAAPAPACISQPITSGSHKRTSPRQESAKKPGQQQLQETAAAADNVRPGSELVGRRVKVFWSADNAWFQGSLSEFSGSSGKHLCEYDDGDQEWLELSNERYELVEQSGPPPRRLNFGGRRQAAKKQRLVLDDSDEEDADMADAASEEVSGSEFEAADASSSSEDENDSTAVEASNEDEPVERKKPAVKASKAARTPKQSSQKAKHAARTPATGGKTPGQLPAAKPPQPRSSAQAKKAASAMQKALADGDAVMPSGKEASTGAVELCSDAARFASRTGRFPFLAPEHIRDANRRRPDHPAYNPRTLHIPADWFKKANVSEGQRQWWEFKAKHFDSLLCFKMGKFYELFEMDAHVGAEVLGLMYMRGDQPHCGFPEVKYLDCVERMVRHGLRVVVVEQTETPEMLKARNDNRAPGIKKSNVVRREVVAILTSGTLTDPDMLKAQPEAAYVLSLCERPLPPVAAGAPAQVLLSACYCDCASNTLVLGQWSDDLTRTQLRAQLAEMRPCELVLPGAPLSEATRKVLKAALRQPRTSRYSAPDSAESVLEMLEERGYFDKWPEVLKALKEHSDEHAQTLSALSLCAQHLQEILLDRKVLPFGSFRQLPGCQRIGARDIEPELPLHMSLDGSAFDNLEVLENTEGGTEGSLMSALDMCATVMGKRRLRAWLCRPMARIADIAERQDAVADLMGPAAQAAQAARDALSGIGDLERALARIQASSAAEAEGANAAIYYEDTAKRKVLSLITALRGLQSLQDAWVGLREMQGSLQSRLLTCMLSDGASVDMQEPLNELLGYTDWEQAAERGRIVPHAGSDANFDAAEHQIKGVEQSLSVHLKDVRRKLNCSSITYVALIKDTHLLEIPEDAWGAVPASYELVSQKKGFRRYRSPRLAELLREHAAAQEEREAALSSVLQGVVRQFARSHSVWEAAVDVVAELDALMSLAAVADVGSAHGPMCRPKLIEGHGNQQVFRAKGLRHPSAGLHLGAGCTFVPNDIELGGGKAPFIILTGPNMGGKSTMLRQVCLAALLAQAGAWVPAESLELTPVDAIFVRMGARDAIMSGQSTFLVELTETAAALNRATCRSLVALDELGRGTATVDGEAIAAAVVDTFTQKTKCRGLFATHYHKLADAHLEDPATSIRHMACHVAKDKAGHEQVTFLYELKEGACPKSYGTACARLAGMPESILARAEHLAAELEVATLPCAANSEQKAGGLARGAPARLPQKCMRDMIECLSSAHRAPGIADLQELQAAAKAALILNQGA